MQSTLFRLAVSLATFALGVVLTTFWLGFSTPTLLTSHEPAPAPAPLATLALRAPSVAQAPEDAPCASAGDPAAKPIIGGVLNGKAVSKPAPVYPVTARAAGVSGTVVVLITVDECGRVESANAISGPELLRGASVEAARKVRFAPTRLSGRPVKVAGTLTYNYLLQ
jgi:protein TonB